MKTKWLSDPLIIIEGLGCLFFLYLAVKIVYGVCSARGWSWECVATNTGLVPAFPIMAALLFAAMVFSMRKSMAGGKIKNPAADNAAWLLGFLVKVFLLFIILFFGLIMIGAWLSGGNINI